MLKRILSLLLCFALLLPVFPVTAQEADYSTPDRMTQTDVKNRMQTLIDLANTKTAFYTYTGTPCNKTFQLGHYCKNCESGVGEGKALNKDSAFRKLVDNFMPSNYTKRTNASGQFSHYYNGTKLFKGTSCSGFANYAGWYIFAQNKSDAVIFKQLKFGAYTKATMSSARIGDIIRLSTEKNSTYGNHSAIVISVGDKSVKVLDCNGVSGKNRQCQLNVHTISYSSVYDYVTISRAENYVHCTEHQYEYGVCTGCGSVKKSFSDYLNNSCTFYKTAVYLQLDQDYKLSSLPMAPADNNESEHVTTVPAGTVLEATGIYKNHYGNYWYAVKYGDKTLYLYGERGDYAGLVPPDFSNIKAPKTLKAGNAFSIGGTITSTGTLAKVRAVVRHADNNKIAIESSDKPNKATYDLGGSTVDDNLKFGQLSKGSYKYQIYVQVNCKLTDGTQLLSGTSEELLLFEQDLTVTSSHTHQYKKTITEPTCTTDGYTTSTCACGSVKKSDTTSALGHDWYSEILGNPCQGTSFVSSVCLRCGETQEEEFVIDSEDGHYYVEEFDDCCFFCGQPNPDSAIVTLHPIPEPVIDGDLKVSFAASGMGAFMQETYLLCIVLFHQETGQLLACEQYEATGEALHELDLETYITPPEGVPLIWKAFLLDEDTMAPISEAASGVVEVEEY